MEVNQVTGPSEVQSTESTLKVGSASGQYISSEEGKEAKIDNSLVQFKASYGKDFKGIKHLVDGITYPMAPETAKQLEERGIGKIVKPAKG